MRKHFFFIYFFYSTRNYKKIRELTLIGMDASRHRRRTLPQGEEYANSCMFLKGFCIHCVTKGECLTWSSVERYLTSKAHYMKHCGKTIGITANKLDNWL